MARTKYKNVNMTEIGGTGLLQYGGTVYEESLRQLVGTKANLVFKEMANNDATIGAILFAIDKMLRTVEWKMKPANDSVEAMQVADFVNSCCVDMDHTFQEFISEVLSMLTFGYSVHEIVYKIRDKENSRNSKYSDNRIGWKKLPVRAQETLFEWEFNDAGDVIAFVQALPTGGSNKRIPMEKILHFRTESRKNNPQGRSILRNAYRAWFYKKRIEEIEGIGIERDLAGLPVAGVPPQILSKNATVEEKALLTSIKKMVTNIRRDAQEGIVFPLAYDDSGKKIYELDLLTTGGNRQFDTSKIIDRYDKRIAMTVLADFILLGQSKVGSFALSSDKTDLFTITLGAWLKDIVGVFNKKAIPDLLELNAIPTELAPELSYEDIKKQDIAPIVDSIYKLVGVGALIPDETVDEKIRELLKLPKASPNAKRIVPKPEPDKPNKDDTD